MQDLKEICLFVLGGLVLGFLLLMGWVYMSQPVKTTQHSFQWQEEKGNWTVSNSEQLPKTIPNGPFFLVDKRGWSFDLTIPYDRFGSPLPATISNER